MAALSARLNALLRQNDERAEMDRLPREGVCAVCACAVRVVCVLCVCARAAMKANPRAEFVVEKEIVEAFREEGTVRVCVRVDLRFQYLCLCCWACLHRVMMLRVSVTALATQPVVLVRGVGVRCCCCVMMLLCAIYLAVSCSSCWRTVAFVLLFLGAFRHAQCDVVAGGGTSGAAGPACARARLCS